MPDSTCDRNSWISALGTGCFDHSGSDLLTRKNGGIFAGEKKSSLSNCIQNYCPKSGGFCHRGSVITMSFDEWRTATHSNYANFVVTSDPCSVRCMTAIENHGVRAFAGTFF